MTKYVLTMTFVVEAPHIDIAAEIAEDIQDTVACQTENRALFTALQDSHLDYIEEYNE